MSDSQLHSLHRDLAELHILHQAAKAPCTPHELTDTLRTQGFPTEADALLSTLQRLADEGYLASEDRGTEEPAYATTEKGRLYLFDAWQTMQNVSFEMADGDFELMEPPAPEAPASGFTGVPTLY